MRRSLPVKKETRTSDRSKRSLDCRYGGREEGREGVGGGREGGSEGVGGGREGGREGGTEGGRYGGREGVGGGIN